MAPLGLTIYSIESARSLERTPTETIGGIFWQTFGNADMGTTSHFEGILLSQTAITLKTGATANGRLLAQTAVALDQNVVVQP